MAKVIFQEDRCKGCNLCVSVCPKKIITLSTGTINAKGHHPAQVIKQEDCIACAFCATICPDAVIRVEK